MTPREALRDQAKSCRALGSPLTAAVCEVLAQTLERDQGRVARRVLDWPGDSSSRGDSVPLRLTGALHALALDGRADALAQDYAQARAEAGTILQTIHENEDFILEWLESPPQTNEVARSAVLIAASRFLRPSQPLALFELGASAGLNLNWPRYRLVPDPDVTAQDLVLRPEWRGPPPEPFPVQVAMAEGVDLRPVDPVADHLRPLAYCWPDQADRMARLRAAIAMAARHPVQVTQGDAAGWLEDRLARFSDAPAGRMGFVYHTVAWQYFPPATQTRCEAALQAAGARATPQSPLAHVSMEAEPGEGAALRLRLWDGTHSAPRRWLLARADFHGRWIDWNPREDDG